MHPFGKIPRVAAWAGLLLSCFSHALPSFESGSQDLQPRLDLGDIENALETLNVVGNPANDFSCTSTVHENPVILLHALLANPNVDLNLLQRDMKAKGYCTYTVLYGNSSILNFVGGLGAMRESSKTIADFVLEVVEKTGKDKVDLVGHSEGGVMTLYVPMRNQTVASHVERIVALGPAVHGAQYYGLTNLWYAGGDISRELAHFILYTLGCAACDDMGTGGAVYEDFLNAEQIVQDGNKATIIMSTYDTLVSPDVSMVNETGVRNIYVQDTCPDDKVGHAGLAWDTSVWGLIYNALTEDYDAAVTCGQGLPVRR